MTMAICQNKLVLAILGVGGVGKCFIKQLAPVSSKFNVTLLYVSTSTKAIYNHNHNPINIDTALEDLSASSQQPLPIPDLVKWLKSVQSAAVIIDNTSSQHIADHYPLILRDGIHIITPNKKAFSGPHELWHHINAASATSGSYVYHEATVGAGLPIISTLKELVETGDSIVKIEGIFSGTMSFLFNSFSRAQGNGGKWSEEVKKAQQLGYTEPDPRDDLNGLDVARKLTILARLAGLTVQSPGSFPVESLIPNDLKSCATAHEFLDKLGMFDDAMEEVKNAASSNGKVIRYTGKIDFSTGSLNVGLGQFDYSHPFASLKGSDNMISFYTKRYGDTPLTIQGAGAGGEVTAMGVTGDLLKLLARCAIIKTL